MSAIRRLEKEFKEMTESSNKDHDNQIYSVNPKTNKNMFEWSGYIFGPQGSPYEGGAFEISIDFPPNYPFKPPKIMFMKPMYHPNIGAQGNICLDILKDKWSPALTVPKILMSIISLLNEPNPEDPLNSEVAEVYLADKSEFEQMARAFTARYAST
jgi:ubiquitin-conjugating enzyme E2 D/E